MQENYRRDHGICAPTFSELGVPLGARLEGDVLFWDDGPYGIHFARLIRDQNGIVVHYTLADKPRDTRVKLPTIEIDDGGILRPWSVSPRITPNPEISR
jgi:hypothetical protein